MVYAIIREIKKTMEKEPNKNLENLEQEHEVKMDPELLRVIDKALSRCEHLNSYRGQVEHKTPKHEKVVLTSNSLLVEFDKPIILTTSKKGLEKLEGPGAFSDLYEIRQSLKNLREGSADDPAYRAPSEWTVGVVDSHTLIFVHHSENLKHRENEIKRYQRAFPKT